MQTSRIPRFYKMSVAERVRAVRDLGVVTREDYRSLNSGDHVLSVNRADKMIENVIGVMGLPVGLGLNFVINSRQYVVPLVVEEPSIVAALSSAAKLIRKSGGFEVESTDPILIGQIQVVDLKHIARARQALLDNKQEILNLANSLHPNMVARGGGAKDMEVLIHAGASEQLGDMLVAHLLVDTCDAMGANLVNTMCESVAPLVEKISGGKVFLRILSNLADRSLVRGFCSIPVENLSGKGYGGEEVRDGIVLASEFAAADPYRAATHNKGIMNGIDAAALATGNDWRAIEAGAHAFAARGTHYTSLSRWSRGDDGALVGQIEIPLKVGIVGGPLESNPTVAMNLRMLNVQSSAELAQVMGAVGLAQNFAALRALATEGIQTGHMTLHARSVVTAAEAPPEIFDTVVERLIESGTIKIWKARELVTEVTEQSTPGDAAGLRPLDAEGAKAGNGKIILLGEHSVVYGRHAIAAPVELAVQARVHDCDTGVHLVVPRWGVEYRMHEQVAKRQSFEISAALILDKLGLTGQAMRIEVYPNVPRAMGLGGSAATAVAIIRALDDHFSIGLDENEINQLAYESEKVAHGTPSGIDNTVATFGKTILYKRGDPPLIQELSFPAKIPVVIAMSGVESLTAKMVARVKAAWEKNQTLYERIFDEIDALTLQAVDALKHNKIEHLGELMNINQGLLNALQVSCWEVEELIQIARENGASGAKLTGGGGGGSIIAICPNDPQRVVKAIRDAGYQAMEVEIG